MPVQVRSNNLIGKVLGENFSNKTKTSTSDTYNSLTTSFANIQPQKHLSQYSPPRHPVAGIVPAATAVAAVQQPLVYQQPQTSTQMALVLTDPSGKLLFC